MTVETRPTERSVRLSQAGLVVGMAVVVVGTFLPWMRSGEVTRNSYAGGGAVKRLLDVGGVLGKALGAWPFVSLACAVAVVLVVLGYYVPGAAVALLAAVVAGAAAIWALSTTATVGVAVDVVGPAITLLGAALTALAVLVRFTSFDQQLDRTNREIRRP